MKAWALRDAETCLYIPWGKHNRHNSAQEFDSKDRPRLFTSKRAAVNTLTAWREGRWRMTGIGYGEEGDYYPDPLPIEGRRLRKIEVVEFALVETFLERK